MKPSGASPAGAAFRLAGNLSAAAGEVTKVTLTPGGNGASDQLPSAFGVDRLLLDDVADDDVAVGVGRFEHDRLAVVPGKLPPPPAR